MKNLLIIICFIVFSNAIFSQKKYTVNNETLELKMQIEGALDLLWNTFDSKFRYFVKDDNNNIQELVNTKNTDNKFQEEYKTVLSLLTKDSNVSVEKTDLTLYDLEQYISTYNGFKDVNYIVTEKAKLKSRIGIFGGLTNNPFVPNPNNASTPFFGAEYEIYAENKMLRHAGFLSIRHALSHDDFDYSATQFALGYRYRFIMLSSLNIYANLKFATYTNSKNTTIIGGLTYNNKTSGFDAPFIFGLGADIKISENSFITLAYNELYAVFVNNQDNFPIDFAIGYKLNL